MIGVVNKKRKKYTDPSNKNSVFHMTSEEVAAARMPKYNGFSMKTGIHGDTKYNRNKAKQESKRIIEEDL